MADYRQIAGEIAGPGHDALIRQIAVYQHANESLHLHIDGDQIEPCPYCWLRAGRAVRVMVAAGALMDSYLKVGEVATRFGVSNMSVYRLIESGQLVAKRFGRVYRIPVSSVTAYEARREDAPRAAVHG